MHLRATPLLLVTKLVERLSSLLSRLQFSLYGTLPALLPADELTTLVRRYYDRSYDGLAQRWRPEDHKWDLEAWEEQVLLRQMAARGLVVVLGTGLGRESLILAERGYRVIGLDHNREGLRLAQARPTAPGMTVLFVQGDFHALPISRAACDYILLPGVMYSAIPGRARRQHHLRRYKEALKPGGKIIVNFLVLQETHMGHHSLRRVNGWLASLPGGNREYQPGDFCAHGHFMHAFVDEAELREELQGAGAAILEINWGQGFAVVS